jgi:hypothetical protein
MTITKLRLIRRLLLQLVEMVNAELRDRGVPVGETIDISNYPRC